MSFEKYAKIFLSVFFCPPTTPFCPPLPLMHPSYTRILQITPHCYAQCFCTIFNPIWVRLIELKIGYWMWFCQQICNFFFLHEGEFPSLWQKVNVAVYIQLQVILQNLKFPRLQDITSPLNTQPTQVLLSTCLREFYAFLLPPFPPFLLLPTYLIYYCWKSLRIPVRSNG